MGHCIFLIEIETATQRSHCFLRKGAGAQMTWDSHCLNTGFGFQSWNLGCYKVSVFGTQKVEMLEKKVEC